MTGVGFADDELTTDGFLGGKLLILQPASGYRAATDPVLLAASVVAKPGQSVLELGCGAGVAALCLGWRVAGLDLTGVELQAPYAQLARRNSRVNQIDLTVVEADIRSLPPDMLQNSFDHVIANPPFFPEHGGTRSADKGKDTAFHEATPLGIWIDAAARRLKPGGYLSVIHLVERVPELLDHLGGRLGGIEVKPITPRAGQPAKRVILRAQKGCRAGFRLHPPLVMHKGDRHTNDCDSYTETVGAILRNGAGLGF